MTRVTQPSGRKNLLRAAAGALPLVPRSDHLPSRTLTVNDIPIDRGNVADYAAVTGLRYGDTVPLTYPFALTFPTVMSLVTGFDFPFAAMGSVHTKNHIPQHRPIKVTDTVNIAVHAENLREHRKGLLVDLVTDVSVGNEVAWHQVTTFLPQQRTRLAGASHPDPPQPDRAQVIRLAERHRARNVQRRGGIGEFGGRAPRRCDIFGAVRQTGGATGQRRTLRRSGSGWLGHQLAQHRQGVSASDWHAAEALAGIAFDE